MGKKSRTRSQRTNAAAVDPANLPVVGMREPCPCGSGKRYKQCHGKESRRETAQGGRRPFAGLSDECDWVALRELVPAGTASARLALDADLGPDADASRAVEVCTVLPLAASVMVANNGTVRLGMQTQTPASADPSRDLAAALLEGLAAEPGESRFTAQGASDGPRLQDVLEVSEPLNVEVHEDFGFWLPDDAEPDPEVAASLERANEAAHPTERLTTVRAAYWCEIGERRHLRWVRDEEEERLLDALARLLARGEAGVVEGSRLVGTFRVHGLVVPVWDLPDDATAEAVEEPAAALDERVAEALASSEPLSSAERSARAGLTSRQVTL